jgi:hypothetical protein
MEKTMIMSAPFSHGCSSPYVPWGKIFLQIWKKILALNLRFVIIGFPLLGFPDAKAWHSCRQGVFEEWPPLLKSSANPDPLGLCCL